MGYLTEHAWSGKGPSLPYLTPAALLTSAGAFQNAECVSLGVQAARIRTAKLVVWYCMLLRWEELRAFAVQEGVAWPIPLSLDDALREFVGIAQDIGLDNFNERG